MKIQKYARVVMTRVMETWSDNGWGITPEDAFPPNLAAQFEPCPDYVEPNWFKINGEWIPPESPPESVDSVVETVAGQVDSATQDTVKPGVEEQAEK